MERTVYNGTTLKKELTELTQNGVRLSLNGYNVEPGDSLVNLLLAENGCTYMRSYEFKGGKVVGISFEKIKLK